MAATCEDERRGRATDPPRRVGGLRAGGRGRRARAARRGTQRGEPVPARVRRVPRRGGRCRRRGARRAVVRRSCARRRGPRRCASSSRRSGSTLTAAGLVAAASFGPTDAAPPTIEQLAPLCHWVAPPDVPVRFDARYFTIESDGAADRDGRRRRGRRRMVDDPATAPGGMAGGHAQALLADLVDRHRAGRLHVGRRRACPAVRDARPHAGGRGDDAAPRDGAGLARAARRSGCSRRTRASTRSRARTRGSSATARRS